MRTRQLVLVAVIAAATSALPAHATTKPKPKPKPKPVCNLVTDPADDGGPAKGAAGAQTNDPNLDIVSADVATDATRLTAVIRVKKLSDPDTMMPAGRHWSITFTVGSTGVEVATTTGPLATNYQQGNSGGTIDTAHNEIRVTMPLANVPGVKIVKGSVLQNFHVSASGGIGFRRADGIGEGMVPVLMDEATTTKTYVAGTPSCVKIGQ
jgi:hypothetical protein